MHLLLLQYKDDPYYYFLILGIEYLDPTHHTFKGHNVLEKSHDVDEKGRKLVGKRNRTLKLNTYNFKYRKSIRITNEKTHLYCFYFNMFENQDGSRISFICWRDVALDDL